MASRISVREKALKQQDTVASFPRTWESRTRQEHTEAALDPRVRGNDIPELWVNIKLRELTGCIPPIGSVPRAHTGGMML
ncbi:MAG: hypothetical protein L3K26_02615, partial [Candidatus Hydrogenedentes bacterium]|nr:hypothetical protein [Candidatus Hydrogenedentota bacterium]